MLLDTEQLNIHLETLSDLKPVPFKSHVEDYVKAFYLPETCLPDWISSHSGVRAAFHKLNNNVFRNILHLKSTLYLVMPPKQASLGS